MRPTGGTASARSAPCASSRLRRRSAPGRAGATRSSLLACHQAALRPVEQRGERGEPADRIGCVRNFRLEDGSELREQLLTLSDMEQMFSYCLLDTPIPLLNYVAHCRLTPVTDGDRCFWEWESRFDTPKGREAELGEMVGDNIYSAGFDAIRREMGIAA